MPAIVTSIDQSCSSGRPETATVTITEDMQPTLTAPKREPIQPRILIQNISFACDRPQDILHMCEQVARFLTTGTHVTIVTEDGKVGWECRVDREGWLAYDSAAT